MVKEKNFDEKRVRNALERIAKAKSKSNQGRLESFFGPAKTIKSTLGIKRKTEEKKGGKGGLATKAKKGKLGRIGGKK